MAKTYDLGAVTAYAIAVEHGYTGTEQEWIDELMATTANAQLAKDSADFVQTRTFGAVIQDHVVQIDEKEVVTDSLTQRAEAANTSAQQAKTDAEAYAVGKRNGVDVSSSDVTYHNNAKYYAETLTTDNTLSITGRAADAKKVGDELTSLKGDLNKTKISESVKQALLNMFHNLAYEGENGRSLFNTLVYALYEDSDVASISAVFNSGGETIYTTDSLISLKRYITLTATLVGGGTKVITDYYIGGELNEGTNVLTIIYGGSRTTISVVAVVNNGYRLNEPVTLTKASSIDSGYMLGGSTQFTVASTHKVTKFESSTAGIVFALYNTEENAYIAINAGHDYYSNKQVIWGMGKTYDTAVSSNKVCSANEIIKSVSTITFTSEGATVYTKTLYTSHNNAIEENTRQYNTDKFTADDVQNFGLYFGSHNVQTVNSIIGEISDLVIDTRIWNSSEINSYLGA